MILILNYGAAVNLARRKRAKFHNEDINYILSSRNKTVTGHLSAEERISVSGIDHTDVFSLSDIIQDGGKYGSVTKDFEDLHAIRRQVLNMPILEQSFTSPLSSSPKFSQSGEITSSNPSTECQKVKGDQYIEKSMSQDVIDLEEPKEIERKRGLDIMSVIIVDSDDEDGFHHVQKLLSCSEHLQDFRECQNSNTTLPLIENRLSEVEGNSNKSHDQGKAKLDHLAAAEWKMPPSIQYEKVVLKSVTDKEASPNIKVCSFYFPFSLSPP